MENKLDWEIIKKNFHPSWHHKIQPFIESKKCWDIFQELKGRKAKKIVTYPTGESKQLFRAFKETRYDDIRAIFVGMSPYHMEYNKIQVCDGLAFSCGNTKKLQPSLSTIYDALERDLGEEIEREPDLTFWANQGVLLLNSSLSVKAQKPDSDVELWQPFIRYLFSEVLNTITGTGIVLFGETAKKQVEKYLYPLSQPHLILKHPAYYSRLQQEIITEDCFNWCNKIIVDNTGEANKIFWNKKEYDAFLNSPPF